MEHFVKVVETVFKYLSTRDKDTFVFGLVVALTIAGLVAGAPPWHTVATGFGFIALYILMRYALLRVQMRERENEMRTIPARKAETIIENTATDQEKISLENMRNSVTTLKD